MPAALALQWASCERAAEATDEHLWQVPQAKKDMSGSVGSHPKVGPHISQISGGRVSSSIQARCGDRRSDA